MYNYFPVKRRYSIKGRRSFKDVIVNGRRFYSKGIRMIVHIQPAHATLFIGNESVSHFSVAVNKNFGDAVERNKIRRRIKSILNTLLPQIQQGFAVIIFPDETCKTMPYTHLSGLITKLLLRSGVLKQ